MPTPRELSWKGAAALLTDQDIAAEAQDLDVPEAALRAVLEIESAGRGFDDQGRPKILFERHVMWRNLVPDLREQANRAGVAWSHWQPGKYPHGSDAMYELLEQACEIDENAAMLACSWGLGQVLGENHKMLGYDDVTDMVLDAMKGEAHQMDQMTNFIRAANLLVPLRALDWEGFAQGYNGPSYRTHGYHLKLERAYERHLAAAPAPVLPPDADGPPLREEARADQAPTYEPEPPAGGGAEPGGVG